MNIKTIALIGFMLVILAFVIAIGLMQIILGYEPCPLCILSRYALGFSGLFFFLLFFTKRTSQKLRIFFINANITSLIVGIAISIRHIWILYNPSLSCDFVAGKENIFGWLVKAFTGTSDCANNPFIFLFLYIPEQALIFYLLLLVLCFWNFLKYSQDSKILIHLN